MSEEIDLNNKTSQELLDIFFNTDMIQGKLEYSNKLRIEILDAIPESIRKHSDKLLRFNKLVFGPIIKKVIEKRLIDWSKISEWKMDLKLVLLRAEYLDLISDEDKNIIRELAQKNPNVFYELSAANKKALNAKLGTDLKYNEEFENELAKVFSKERLSSYHDGIWNQTGSVSGGYCWAKATYQAVHKIYDYNYWSQSDNYENILMPYVKDIKKEYPEAWKDSLSSGSGGKHPYACLYESKRTEQSIVAVELTINSINKLPLIPIYLIKQGRIQFGGDYSTGVLAEYVTSDDYDGSLDIRNLISVVLNDKCPVVIGREIGIHAQYLVDDATKRKLFLRCVVEFLFYKTSMDFSDAKYSSFSVGYIAGSGVYCFSEFLANLFGEEVDGYVLEDKIDDTLKNIKDSYSRACEKIKFGKFFCEEFIKQYIDERDKNKNLDMDPRDFLDAALKDFIENHVDKKLFKPEKQKEKSVDPPKSKETTDQHLEHEPDKIKSKEKNNLDKNPEDKPNNHSEKEKHKSDSIEKYDLDTTKPKEKNNLDKNSEDKPDPVIDEKQIDNKQSDPTKVEENIIPKEKIEIDKNLDPAANEKQSEPEINIDEKIDRLSRTIKNSNEIESLRSELNSVGKFLEFKDKFKEKIENKAKNLYNSFECYLNEVKIMLSNYVELFICDSKVKNKFIEQINDLNKVSIWRKILEIIIGILNFNKNRITKPKESVIFSRLKDTEKTLLNQSNNQKCNKSLTQ